MDRASDFGSEGCGFESYRARHFKEEGEKKMSIVDQIKIIKESLNGHENVVLIAASKYMDLDFTKRLIEQGITHFGENRTDMLLEKYEALSDHPELKWHFFGTLQSRKVRDVVGKISYLHSLDRIGLAMELDKRLTEPLDCFIQVNITNDEKKSGVPVSKLKMFVKSLGKYSKIRVIGLMCIAPLTFDMEIIEDVFIKMEKLKKQVQDMNLEFAPCTELSMGMSNDYKLALEHGATFIRLGRIFMQ